MPFVKLDCGILHSTLWFERDCRDVFITALLMAEPFETATPLPQIEVTSLNYTGWSVPPGWYGFVPAAGVGIIDRAKVSQEHGIQALKRLGEPEDSSRSREFDGRRLVRVDGGYIVLNFMKYRERDYTTAERSRRYRERKLSRRDTSVSHRDITQAEAEVEKSTDPFETFWSLYPRKVGKGAARRAFLKLHPNTDLLETMLDAVRQQAQQPQWKKDGGQFIPHPATWLNQARWDDDPDPSRKPAEHEPWICRHIPRCPHRTACWVVSQRKTSA